MQNQDATKVNASGNTKRIEVQVEQGSWQRPEEIKLQPAFAVGKKSSFLNHALLAEVGVPFSLHNN
jgi:hypothetical protein